MERVSKKRKLRTSEGAVVVKEEIEDDVKPIKIENVQGNQDFRYFESLESKQLDIMKMTLKQVRIPDLENLYFINKHFFNVLSNLRKNNTYLLISKLKTEDLPAILETKRQFNEIFFYGNQDSYHVKQILQKFGKELEILKFVKSNYKFLEVHYESLSDWLKLSSNITELDLINIEIKNLPNDDVSVIPLRSLTKLRCYDSFLNLLISPSLVKFELQVIDGLNPAILERIQKFIDIHFRLKHFDLRVFGNEDDFEVQDISLKLDHLALNTLILREFRFNPHHVAEILSNQKDLVMLHLEDGTLSNDTCDAEYLEQLDEVFDKILNLNKLNKLVIEMPSVDFLNKLQNLPNLKRLTITNISQTDLRLLKNISNFNLDKLCIVSIGFGKKSIEESDVKLLNKILKNIQSLKIDTTLLYVMKKLLIEILNLKVLKIIRNSEIAKKNKQMVGENVELPVTNLEKIICDNEDFKMRILPIIKKSPHLIHVKIYWDDKNTPFMSIVFDILKSCPNMRIIEFIHGSLFVKEDILPDSKTYFYFCYKNMEFEHIILRKEAKIICRRIN